jgi:hypothetical protein
MTDENSNPETGELSDDAAVEMLNAMRQQPAAEAEAETEEAPEEAAETEETEAEAETESEPEEEPARYTVKIDGVESEVTLDELVKGFQLEADYRRKTQTLADERREIAAEKSRQQEITANLVSEYQKLVGNDEPEPDWVKLAEEDPLGYVQKRAQFEAKQARKEQARRHTEELVNRQRAEIGQAEVAKLRDKVPEWRDPEAFSRDFQAIEAEASKHYGFNAAELRSVIDHRALMVLRDAAAYRRLQGQKSVVEKKVAAAPKSVVKPGSVAAKATVTAQEVEAARNRFSRSGSDEDAVALLRAKRTR